MPYYKAEDVRKHTKGNWLDIFSIVAPNALMDAMEAGSRHVTCPVHGGKKDFRLFNDAHETGASICNSSKCKNTRTGKQGFGDGFETLMFVNGWTFQEALFAVGQALQIEPRLTKEDYEQQRLHQKSLSKKNAANSNRVKQPVAQAPAAPKPVTSSASQGERYAYEDKKMMAVQNYDMDTEDDYSDYSDYVNFANEPAAQAPVAQAPVAQAPVAQAPVAQAPVAQAPVAEAPVAEAPVAEAPVAQLVSNEYAVSPEHLAEIKRKFEARNEQRKQYGIILGNRIDELVEQCITLDEPEAEPVWRYFKNRGIVLSELDANNIMFHPSLPYYGGDDNKHLGNFPAIICLITDKDDNLITLHRIYITEEGEKISIPELEGPTEVKKMMPIPDGRNVIGASIRTGEPIKGVLGVAEGLETALAAMVHIDIPVWSCINATLMERFEPPSDVHTVIIWADKDKSKTGEISADILADKLSEKGITVYIMMPTIPIPNDAKGVDWNDVLIEQGFLGFPKSNDIWSAVLDEQQRQYA